MMEMAKIYEETEFEDNDRVGCATCTPRLRYTCQIMRFDLPRIMASQSTSNPKCATH